MPELCGYHEDPEETLETEYKSWLDLRENADRATLAKALLALHNHGGGQVVIGFDEVAGRLIENVDNAPNAPRSAYAPDEVIGVVDRYCDPSFVTRVQFCVLGGGPEHPVIDVPGAIGGPAPRVKNRAPRSNGEI